MKREEIETAIANCFNKGLTKEGNIFLVLLKAYDQNTEVLESVHTAMKTTSIPQNGHRQGTIEGIIQKISSLESEISQKKFVLEV